MRLFKVNLLKLFSICAYIAVFALEINCQKIKQSVYIQGFSFTSTNFPEVKSAKKLFDYNFGYNINYQKLTIYIDKYYVNEGRRIDYIQNKIKGQMVGYTINSFSVVAGYNLFKYKNVNLISGIGLRYNNGIIGWFDDDFPKPWEAKICHEYSKSGPVLLSELNLSIYKGFSIGLLSRYNPMINKFPYEYVANDVPCFNKHTKDRFNYLTNQLVLKFTF
jgi:hypothetical protein